jgi:eukaryotic-like serine/threonine-protein kinase
MAADDVFGIVGTTQAGNFKVERVVAEGGFGVVYRAQHGGFRAPVAIKCLKVPEDMSQLQRNVFLEKFREEAELLFRLSAAIPEVVRPLHVDVLQQKDGRFVPFLAMEWLEGESLDQIIVRRHKEGQPPLGLPKLVKMLKPLAVALSRSHHFQGPRGTESIIHRDLKPENVFVATLGGVESVKVLDFGIAKAKRVASQAAVRLVESATSLGLGPQEDSGAFTPGYGAPEQWSPKRFGETGPWTDVWGLALTMVEVLVGGPAIDGDTAAMRKIALDEARRPTPMTLGAPVPSEVDRIFLKALAVQPRARYQDIASFWGDLEEEMGMARSFPKSSGVAPAAASSGPGASTPLARIGLQKRLAPASQPGAPERKRQDSASFDFDLDELLKPSATEEPLEASLDGPEEASLEASLDGPEEASLEAPLGGEASLEASLDAPEPASLEFDLGGGDPEPPPAPALPAPAKVAPAPAKGASGGAPAAGSGPSPAAAAKGGSGPSPAGSGLGRPAPPRRMPSPPASGELDLEIDLPPVGSSPAPAARAPAPDTSAAESLSAAFDVAVPRRPASGPARPPISERFDLAPAPRPTGNIAPIRESTPGPTLGERLRVPVGMLLLAIAVSASDFAYTKVVGTPLTFGPVRPFWIAAPLAIVGVILTLIRLLGGDGDD